MRVDVRIIAATNHDLARAVKEGAFREDLFFRLNVIPIALPPLRERKGDVIQLVHHFSLLHFKRTGQLPPTWTPQALDVFEKHPWPGNVRELANIVERISIVNPGAEISGEFVRAMLNPNETSRALSTQPAVEEVSFDRGLNEMLDEWERGFIKAALADAKGNVAEAARLLKTDRANLYRRMKRLDIES